MTSAIGLARERTAPTGEVLAWEAGPALRRLAPGSVHVWSVDLDAPPRHVARLRRVLAPDELDRAARFRFERDRIRYAICRGTLRTLLAGYLDREPEQVNFAYGPSGKPHLSPVPSAGSPRFNVSHAGSVALIALTPDREIGVDVEQVRPMPDLSEVAARFFAQEERAQLEAWPLQERVEPFFRCWTRKEALIKATGEGLSRPLDSFAVSLADAGSARVLRFDGDPDPGEWTLRGLEPADSYVGALALRGTVQAVHCWRFTVL